MELPSVLHAADGRHGAFAIEIEGTRLAVMTYHLAADQAVVIEHTEVDDSLRGTGAGKKLLAALIAWARAEGRKVVPICPFAKSVIEKTPDYQDVLR